MFETLRNKFNQNKIIFSGMIIVTFGSVFSSFLNYYFNFYIQSLFPDFSNFGNFSFLITVLMFSQIIPLSIAGSLNLVVTELKVLKDYSRLTHLYIKMLVLFGLMGLFLSLSVFSLADLISNQFKIGNIFYVQLLAVSIFVSTLCVPVLSFLYGMLRFKSYSFMVILAPLLKLILITVLYYMGFSFLSILYAFILTSILTFFIGNFFLLKDYDREFKLSNVNSYIKRVFYVSMPILFITLGNYLINNVDFLIVKANFSEEISGKYGYIQNLGKIYFFGSLLFVGAMVPQITEAYNQKKKYFNLLFFYAKIVVSVSTVGLIILGLFTRQFLDLFVYFSSLIGLRLESLMFYYQVEDYVPLYTVFTFLIILINFFVLFLIAISRVRIFLIFMVAIMFQTILILNFGKDIFSVLYCNIFVGILLLIYLIFEVYGKYVDFNNSSRL
jgi:O-antigen/teichoic acid export membrane protein